MKSINPIVELELLKKGGESEALTKIVDLAGKEFELLL